MDCRNFRERLSEFLDRQLAASDHAQAQSHMAACSGCRSEFEELKGVSQMVSGVRRKPLPVGFMQRLERRRQAGGAPAPAREYFLLPPGLPRLAAFALSSLIVMFVVFDKARTMLQPSGSIAMISGAVLDQAATKKTLRRPPGELALAEAKNSMDEKAAQAAITTSTGHKLARARGEPLATAESLAVAKAAPASPPAAAERARNWTNEELAANIEKQKKALGIRKIVAPGNEQQRLQVAMLQALRGAAPAGAQAEYAQVQASPAALGGGDTPMIISNLSAGNGAVVPELRRSDKAGKLDEAPGVLIRSEAERDDLWHKYQMTATAPKVDYATQMLAVVFATSPSTAIQISRVTPSEDRIVVYFHEVPVSPNTAAPAYQFRVIAKTDKPVVFEKLP